jgi:NhaA family Na+:H+ antiporter
MRSLLPERRRVAALLRTETVGGALLVGCALVALVLANSPLEPAYAAVRDLRIGPAALHLDLSIQQWTADGLLALFFFLAGLELKREFTAGELRDPRRAVVPVVAAIAGMAAPAGIYLLTSMGEPGAAVGWAIPTATDIAFALAVLAVIGPHLPVALRTFLLTLAVVDDLLAIIVIALFYTRELHPEFLALSLIPLLGFGIAVQRRMTSWWLLVPLALAAWGLMHASGVHATVAGVLMGFAVPVLGPRRSRGSRGADRVADPPGSAQDLPGDADHLPGRAADPPGRAAGLPGGTADRSGDGADVGDDDGTADDASDADAARYAERLEHLLRPISAGVAVPLFAFFAAGVSIGGLSGLGAALGTRVVLGIVIGMVVGKSLGILLATVVVGRLSRSSLLRELVLPDIVGLSILGGVGFTVSLLIGDLAFGAAGERAEHVQIAVLAGSLIASLLAAAVLAVRNRHYRAMSRRPPPAPD